LNFFRNLKELRVWSLTDDHQILTVKLIISSLEDYENTLTSAKEIVLKKYDIEDVTIQIEVEKL
jgi:Co/Zn/Cd efflux system component